ncbi:MAG: inorganic phosphate transporter [Methanomassiliicoccus sp.]|nr:inorganic phosphate transporter [Methanomassiliicoccus sp.]
MDGVTLIEMALLIVAVVIVTLFFAFTNGFQDSSATVATMVACRAATPRTGVVYSAAFGFLGVMLGGSAVAFTIENLVTVSDPDLFVQILLSAVLSAASWNIITWWFGLPSSSTHALVGGLVGAGVAGAGASSIDWGFAELSSGQVVGLVKVLLFLVLSVAIGFAAGFAVKRGSMIALRNAKQSINRPIRRAQYVTTAVLAFAHGANDGQKQMGIIAIALASGGLIAAQEIPLWVRLLTAIAIAMGTIGGGWKIMKTLGRKIYPIKAIDSLDSQLASSCTILLSTAAGAPVSSTQVVASSVMGVGAGERVKMVQWSVGKHMVISWLLTIPASAMVSALLFNILRLLLGG